MASGLKLASGKNETMEAVEAKSEAQEWFAFELGDEVVNASCLSHPTAKSLPLSSRVNIGVKRLPPRIQLGTRPFDQ